MCITTEDWDGKTTSDTLNIPAHVVRPLVVSDVSARIYRLGYPLNIMLLFNQDGDPTDDKFYDVFKMDLDEDEAKQEKILFQGLKLVADEKSDTFDQFYELEPEGFDYMYACFESGGLQ